jgi:hypothetical protein
LRPSASNGGPQAEQAGDQQCRDTQDIVRHWSSPSPKQKQPPNPLSTCSWQGARTW